MARENTIVLGALNVVMHPHPSGSYSALFRKAHELQRQIFVRRDQVLSIGSCFPIVEGSDETGFQGDLFRFMEIDPNEPWFNLADNRAATTSEVRTQVAIPKHLKPKFKQFRYAFFPEPHLLVVVLYKQSDSISIDTVQKFLSAVLNDSELRLAGLPEVSVTPVQSKEDLQRIWSYPEIDQLEIFVKRPNADEGDKEEKQLLDLMKKQGIGAQEIKMFKGPEETIKPNQQTKAWAEIALSNGHVKAIVKGADHKRRIESTSDHPRREQFKMDLTKGNFLQRFLEEARDFVTKIRQKTD